MLKLTHRYASALMEYATQNGLAVIYRQALLLVSPGAPDAAIPPEIGGFLGNVPEQEVEAVLYRFLDMARKEMDLLPVEIISAVELTKEQLALLEEKLILMFRKQLDITTTIDPSILGGLRVIAGDTVLDDTIKRKLQDLKENVYQGVYFT